MLITTACTLISAAGLGVSFLVARRRRYAAALRVAAVSLLPVGLAMTGVVRFVVNMTFNPVAWAGFGVVALSVLLFFVARFADGGGRRSAEGSAAAEPAASTGQSAAPAALPESSRKNTPASSSSGGSGEDFSDIEAILKKHGI